MVRRPLGNHHVGPDTLLVTSDTTQTDLVAEETENLRKLIAKARFILFDFDGPICRLFAGHTAEDVARRLVEWLESRGLRGLLTEEERVHPDPHYVLEAIHRRHPQSDLVTELEERLTQQELKAVTSAMPTPYADPLIRTWSALGGQLAVATNNSARVATAYLARRDLDSCFAPYVFGRTHDLDLLKPHPHCLNQALNAMGADRTASLMIGDAPSDFYAAQNAGVAFIGFARNQDKEKRLRSAGTEVVVESLEPVLRMLRGQA
ncbi:HAD family hydrolase [Streptomyces sp. NPDC127159]|uniref:HAD family hydrolase n=1 Tax=unclassified Streptomyces TaxID=2593676 RepID=UPI0036339B76